MNGASMAAETAAVNAKQLGMDVGEKSPFHQQPSGRFLVQTPDFANHQAFGCERPLFARN
jgi:hypothetical protein